MSDAALRARLAPIVRDAFGTKATITATERLHGDASSRVYVRARLRGAGPSTVVAMLLADGPRGTSDELGGSAEAPPIESFVDVGRYLARHALPVPVIHLDASAARVLLVEDVGDRNLWQAAEAHPERAAEHFADAVDLLVRLQVVGTRHPDPACGAFRRRFDGALAAAEIEHFIEHGIETRRGAALSDDARAELHGGLAPLLAPFEDGPTVLAHRDYMAWNIHVDATGLRLIDFQDALIAPDAFDLAQLLTDRTTTTILDAADRAMLIDRFEQGRAAAGLTTEPGLGERIECCALQHALKVIGRFHYLELACEKPGYLAYLPAVYAVARASLARVPNGRAMTAVLARWVPELAADAR